MAPVTEPSRHIKQEEFSQPAPLETDLDRVREFFEYSLPSFVPHKDHSSSRTTRPPARFDRHLEDHLILKRVIYKPSLVTSLETIADQALMDYTSIRPLPSTLDKRFYFPRRTKRNEALRRSEHSKLLNEKSIEEVYLHTMASHCGVVASTLEFHLPGWYDSYFKWTTQHRSDENYAIADGILELVAAPVAIPGKEPPPPLPEVYSQIIEDFPVLGVWEFKSLVAGSIEVFEAILGFARKEEFAWVGCDAGSLDLCTLQHSTDAHAPLTTWSPLGPDASPSAWPEPEGALCPPHDEPSLPEPLHKIKNFHLTHGIHIVQQTFAEMVKHDTTFGCLNAGKYEMYFRRDRGQNAMYITDIIRTNAPGRAKVLTGLFIAAIRDAKDRSAKLRHGLHLKTWCKINPYENLHMINFLPPEAIIAEVRARPFLVLLAQDKKDQPASFLPNSPYSRISSPDVGRAADKTAFSDSSISITIPAQQHTSTGVLKISGRHFCEIPGRFSPFVVVKNTNHPLIARMIEYEHKVYLDLAADGVTCIPEVIGLFRRARSDDTPHINKLPYTALVLEHVGTKSLADVWEEKRKIPQGLSLQAQVGLKRIHAADYCYGSEFSLHDIIVRDEGLEREAHSRVSFVSFGKASRITEEWQKRAELEALVKCLENPRKHILDTDDEHVNVKKKTS
ncbi:hypothetical protein FPV67DRAFT_1660521 [Lyophyllum atratum]|nr:hypothetical protein FPV67DRAFT_1660521 [Lyophyllum atratum]